MPDLLQNHIKKLEFYYFLESVQYSEKKNNPNLGDLHFLTLSVSESAALPSQIASQLPSKNPRFQRRSPGLVL